MPRTFVIKDASGVVLGRLRAPDDATNDQIAAMVAKAKDFVAAKAAAATESSNVRKLAAVPAAVKPAATAKVACGICKGHVPRDQFPTHVQQHATNGDHLKQAAGGTPTE